MPSDQITLSSSIRQNLLSLQNTTRLLDLTSNRLSTGLKVNSSLDNPASFFAARSLTNRASDLNSRKDGIGQGISLLQSTDKSITAITSLVEQAKAKVTEADEAATQHAAEAYGCGPFPVPGPGPSPFPLRSPHWFASSPLGPRPNPQRQRRRPGAP